MKVITQPNYKKYIFIFFCLVFQITTFAQTQKGANIENEDGGGESGRSVSMPDAYTVAIGTPFYSHLNSTYVGRVRIYTWNGSAWVQKGTDIDGEATYFGGMSGYSVSMPDANTLAIGAPTNDGIAYDAGHVRIYSWSGTVWVQKGTDIDGKAEKEELGSSVSMPDAYTVAIGAPSYFPRNSSNVGHVRIYSWSGSDWTQKGADIDGDSSDYSGHHVSMPDANTVAIAASNAGHVRIYSWSGTAWVQKGTDIDGEASGYYTGGTVSMPDANTVAIGARRAGHVRIYSWSGTAWVQKGTDIDGEAEGDEFGNSVSMPDANTVAVGAPLNDAAGYGGGHVRIYSWSGSDWTQKGADIVGERSDYSGSSVSMPDTNTVAIGAPGFITSYGDGRVRIYTLNNNLNIEKNDFGPILKAFPNPTLGELNVELGTIYQNVTVIIKNSLGQKLFEKWFNKEHLLNLIIPDKSDVYLIEIQADDKSAILKVIKK